MNKAPALSELAEQANRHYTAAKVETIKALGWAAVGTVFVAGGIIVGGLIGGAVGLIGAAVPYWQSAHHLRNFSQEKNHVQSYNELSKNDGPLPATAEQLPTE